MPFTLISWQAMGTRHLLGIGHQQKQGQRPDDHVRYRASEIENSALASTAQSDQIEF